LLSFGVVILVVSGVVVCGLLSGVFVTWCCHWSFYHLVLSSEFSSWLYPGFSSGVINPHLHLALSTVLSTGVIIRAGHLLLFTLFANRYSATSMNHFASATPLLF
jgi:hypothetical protein